METALKIFSWICVILGAIAIVFASTTTDPTNAVIGGGLFLVEGILALAYIKSQ